ncbi:MAG: YicC family protein [Marinilabiliales bacterium]|nr:MAG: YicC family protein [Marinilabiliales bacterium]
MIKSMTGCGKATCELPEKKVTIEMRSLNSRNLDINIKLPGILRDREALLRSDISQVLCRGKIDVVVTIDHTGTEHIPVINRNAVRHYFEELSKTAADLRITGNHNLELMKLAMRMPDILITGRTGADENEWAKIYGSFREALGQVDKYRGDEGEAMKTDLVRRIADIEENLGKIEQFEALRIETIRARLQQNLNEFLGNNNVDRNRFEQEILFYLEKLDITEEKVRLSNHMAYFRETLSGKETAGKKIGFICQEIGREINTIGSKANDFNIQKLVVQMKDDLEKIKEQSLNIL